MSEIAFRGGQGGAVDIDRRRLRNDMAIRRVGRVGLVVLPILTYLFLWIPIAVMIVFSFNASRTNAVWRGFTLEWYNHLLAGQFGTEARFSTTNLLNAVGRSLIIAFSSTTISTLLGTAIAIGLERYRVRFQRGIELLLYLPVVIPEITMGLSLLIFFSFTFGMVKNLTKSGVQLELGLVTMIIGHVVFSMPFVAIAVRARITGMPKSYEEAARDLGANEFQTFMRVTLPLLVPGILAGALLALTLSLDDFVVSFFVSGPGSTTLPLFVQGLIKFQVTPDINAISTVMVIASMGLVLLSTLAQRNQN